MGLGLYCGSRPKRRGLWPFRAKERGLLDRTADCAQAYAEAAELGPFFASWRQDGNLLLRLHPGEEPMALWVLEGGDLVCSAKTSNAGPGYHQFAVGLLDRIGQELDLEWEWAQDDDGSGDSTGYGVRRDFAALQQEMAAFLRSLAGWILERADDCKGLMLGVPMGFHPERRPGIVTQLGDRPLSLFRQIADASDDELLEIAADYFPWWEDGLTAKAWRNIGLVRMWTEARWTPPESPEDKAALASAVYAMERAATLDPRLPLPEREIAEIHKLMDSAHGGAPDPQPFGIGYRRGPWRFDATAGWSVEAPGWFRERWTDDGGTLVLGHGAREIWLSTFGLQPAKPPTRAIFGDKLSDESFVFEQDGLLGSANPRRHHDEDGSTHWTLEGAVHRAGGFATLTVAYGDEADLDWAKGVFMSVRCRGDEA